MAAGIPQLLKCRYQIFITTDGTSPTCAPPWPRATCSRWPGSPSARSLWTPSSSRSSTPSPSAFFADDLALVRALCAIEAASGLAIAWPKPHVRSVQPPSTQALRCFLSFAPKVPVARPPHAGRVGPDVRAVGGSPSPRTLHTCSSSHPPPLSSSPSALLGGAPRPRHVRRRDRPPQRVLATLAAPSCSARRVASARLKLASSPDVAVAPASRAVCARVVRLVLP